MGELGPREPGPPDGYGQGQSGPGQKLTNPRLTPSAFWNEDPRNQWFDHSNLGTAMIDGVKTTCLIDNGARVNLVTPEFLKSRGLEVGSIQDLNDHDGYIPLSGLGGKITKPLGYVILWVQIPYVPSYDEDQVALVVSEDSNFLRRCQVILGTPTINRAVRAMKESEMENAPEAWWSAIHSYEFANYVVQLDPEDYGMTLPTNTGENPIDLDELVLLKNKTTIPSFGSIILHCRTRKRMMMGYKLHVMTQATYPEDGANLPYRTTQRIVEASQRKSKPEGTVVKLGWGSWGQGSLAPPDRYGQGQSSPGQKLTNPHDIGVVSHEPAVLHSAGQSEVQMHPDVVVQGAVIGRGIGTEWAILVCHLPLHIPAFENKGTTLFNLPGGSRAYDIIQPDVPVPSIV